MSEGGHSILAPSAASRWTVCTASVGYIAANKDRCDFGSSSFADEGTDAHSMAEAMLSGKPIPTLKYRTPEMDRIVGEFVAFVRSLIEEGCIVTFEKRVPLYYGEGKGTIDVKIVNPARKTLHIVDLKYGAGTPVYAQKNKQLAIYARSAVQEDPTIKEDWLVVVVIYQPRDRSDSNAIRLWALNVKELYHFCAEISRAVELIRHPDVMPCVKFHPDPETTCKFCPAKKICDARQTYGLEALPEEAEVTTPVPFLPPPATLSREKRIRIIAARKIIEDWLEAVEDAEVALLLNGAAPAGYKLVEGKSNRAWKDPQKAALALGEYLDGGKIYKPLPTEREVLSVAEAEGMIGKKDFESLKLFITKPPRKPTLVPESDKRPPLNLGPTADFQKLDAPPGSEFI